MITKIKIFENSSSSLFKNEHELKEILIKDEDFAKGEVHQAINNIMYDKWEKNNDWGYDNVVEWFSNKFGTLPEFCIYLGSYNGQVCDGGHHQYFDNGYASSESKGMWGSSKDTKKHDEFIHLFKELDLDKIEFGKEAYNIANRFELELDDEYETCSECGGSGDANCEDCNGYGTKECGSCGGSGEDSEDEDEYCSECGGDGEILCDTCSGDGSNRCEECDGSGEYVSEHDVPNTYLWEKLDSEWYKVNDSFMDSFDNYLKTLTLDGEKISDLVETSKETQNFNL